jgi:hypothetical protein
MSRGHPSRVRVWLVVAGVVTVLLAALEVLGDYRMRGRAPDDAAWESPAIAEGIARVDEALAAKDITAAVRAWRDARAVALGRSGWESMVALGDAYLRIGDGAEFRRGFTAGARESYLMALFRARDERSIDGVLRTAQAFAALGDVDVVGYCLQVASRLAARDPDPRVREVVAEVANRLRQPADTAGIMGPAP